MKTYPCSYCTSRYATWKGLVPSGKIKRACRRHKEKLQNEAISILFPNAHIKKHE